MPTERERTRLRSELAAVEAERRRHQASYDSARTQLDAAVRRRNAARTQLIRVAAEQAIRRFQGQVEDFGLLVEHADRKAADLRRQLRR